MAEALIIENYEPEEQDTVRHWYKNGTVSIICGRTPAFRDSERRLRKMPITLPESVDVNASENLLFYDSVRMVDAMAALRAVVGPFQQSFNCDVVPVEVAAAGNPAVVTYLASNNCQASDIAEKLDIKQETVQKYISRFLERAEKQLDDSKTELDTVKLR